MSFQGYQAHDTEFSGTATGRRIPVITEISAEGIEEGWHEASDDEYDAYLNYWNEECPNCGLDRGSHLDPLPAGVTPPNDQCREVF